MPKRSVFSYIMINIKVCNYIVIILFLRIIFLKHFSYKSVNRLIQSRSNKIKIKYFYQKENRRNQMTTLRAYLKIT